MSSEDWCRQELDKLKNKDARLETLTEIKNQLYHETPEITIASNFLKSPEIFQCLDEAGKRNCNVEEIDLVLDILSICMSSLDLDRFDYAEILQKSLKHSYARVQSLALNEIVKYLRKNLFVTSLDVDLTMTIINCLDQNETSVGAVAVEILSQILISNITDENIKNEFLKRCDSTEVIRCRIYEICVNLAKNSPSLLNEVEIVLSKMLSELNNQDVLLQLNILELLVSLAEQNHGLVYLENRKIFEKISKRVERISENPLESILVPGFMKFFGKIAYSQPQKIINGYPNMIQYLLDRLLSDEICILPTAFDTLGNLAHSSQGKLLLEENYSENLVECFKKFRVYLLNLPTELKIREFIALEVIFKTEGHISQEISNITQKWWLHFNGSTDLRILFGFCKNPFPEMKNVCLSLTKTLCKYQWGVTALKDTAGFVEYLLDRSVEFNQDSLFIKYEIIQILSESTVFDIQTMLQLKKYVDNGVNYIEGIVEIAMESV